MLDGFGVAFGDQVVLADVFFAVPRRGATLLVGPAGAGKSTLIRTLVGLNDAQPALRTWGAAYLNGERLAEQRRRNPDSYGVGTPRRIAMVR